MGMFKNRSVPVVLQGESADCGLACVAMLCQFHRLPLDLIDLKSSYGSSAQGASLFELHEIAGDLGFAMRGVQFELTRLGELALPAIVHWSGNHFVVLEALHGATLTIVDPAFGRTRLSTAHAAQYLSGYALEVVSAPAAKVMQPPKKRDGGPSIADLIWSNRQIWPAIGMVGLGATMYQLLGLAVPYLVSLVVDKAVVPNSPDTLALIMWVFFGFFMARIAVLFINTRLQAHLHFSLSTALYGAMTRHLLSLPYLFFIKRSAADIHARLRTLDAAYQFFVSGIFEVPFSALYLTGVMGLLFYLDPLTAAVALGFTALTVAMEWPAQLFLEGHQNCRTQADIEETKTVISSLSRIDQIKLNSAESREFSELSSRQRQRIAAGRDLEVAGRDVRSIGEAVHLVEKLAVIYLLAASCMKGELSLGLAIAFLLFSDEIKDRLMRLINVWSTYRSSRLQMSRLEEVCREVPEFAEQLPAARVSSQRAAASRIELHAAAFAYHRVADNVLEDVSIVIEPGEKVVLYGPSGSGKSTLLRLLSSLLSPTAGTMTVNGAACDGVVKARFRHTLGGMFAEDRLSDGTVRSNITRDVAHWNEEDVQRVLRITRLDQAFAGLQSGLDTAIAGDGRGLSSGQTQRVLLARALMRQTPILLLDEPTSHCDAETARSIIGHLADYQGTVIVCTHDADFVAAFGTAYRVSSGRIELMRQQAMPQPPAAV